MSDVYFYDVEGRILGGEIDATHPEDLTETMRRTVPGPLIKDVWGVAVAASEQMGWQLKHEWEQLHE